MKKLFVTLCALFAILSLSAADNAATTKIKGSGVVKTEVRRKVQDFTEVSVSAGIDLYLKQGHSFSVEVRADERIIEYVRTAVRGNRLEIGYERGISYDNRNKVSTKVYVVMPEIEAIHGSSAADICLQSDINADGLVIMGSSAADFDLGEYQIKCSSLKIGLSSSSDLEGGKFRCSDVAKVEASASADIDTYIKTNICKVSASSASDIEIAGMADYLEVSASSGSDINLSNMESKAVDVQASSAAEVVVYATEKLDASASSAGSIRFYGSPKELSRSASSGGSVRAK